MWYGLKIWAYLFLLQYFLGSCVLYFYINWEIYSWFVTVQVGIFVLLIPDPYWNSVATGLCFCSAIFLFIMATSTFLAAYQTLFHFISLLIYACMYIFSPWYVRAHRNQCPYIHIWVCAQIVHIHANISVWICKGFLSGSSFVNFNSEYFSVLMFNEVWLDAGLQFENSCEVGVFSKLTNAYCLVAIGGSENFYRYSFVHNLYTHVSIPILLNGLRFYECLLVLLRQSYQMLFLWLRPRLQALEL